MDVLASALTFHSKSRAWKEWNDTIIDVKFSRIAHDCLSRGIARDRCNTRYSAQEISAAKFPKHNAKTPAIFVDIKDNAYSVT